MDDYVSFEVANKLKEKSYPMTEIPTGGRDNRNAPVLYDLPKEHPNWQDCKAWWVPTISQVLKWLREEKEVDLVIEPIFCYDKNIHREYGVRVFAPSLNKPVQCGYFNKWEKASIVGIEYVLDNLI